MKLIAWIVAAVALAGLLPSAHSQVVTIPIPGSPLSLNVMVNPQPLQNINNNALATRYQLWDDGWANVPLGFEFPFFDKKFTNSTMYSNGAVQFGASVNGFPANNTFCCNGITIDKNTPPAYNHSILMMQTDLYGDSGNNHYSLGTANSMTYGWYGVERLGVPQNKTSFELKIDNTGGIDMRWTGALITMNTPAIGIIGDASKGEFLVLQQGSLNQEFVIPGLTQMTTGPGSILIDPCVANPLYSQTCAGYAAAYLDQQCAANPLYASNCPGYAAAYKTQQCTATPLYATDCPGYQEAYKTQQCTATPLYSTDCLGYAEAYFNQQCLLDSLFSNKCEGYKTAYAIKYLVNLDPAVTTAVNAALTTTVEVQRNDPATVATVADATVNAVISAPSTTSATSVTSPMSVVNVAPAPSTIAAASAPPPPPPPAAAAEQKADAKKTDSAVASVEKKGGGNATAARAAATEKAKELANDVSRAATLEAQAATQGVLVGLIGYVPGFSAYQNSIVPDSLGASVEKQYYKSTVDNRSAQRQLSGANEARWKQIVDSQYNKEK